LPRCRARPTPSCTRCCSSSSSNSSCAIVGIQRIEHRILGFSGLLARRLGRQQSGGIRIPLALEQKRIEEILSAGHTQATTAFRALFAAGVLVHDAAGWRFDPPISGR
jgi:hypothetical protein